MKSDSSDSIETKRTWVAQILEEGIKEKYNDKKISIYLRSPKNPWALCFRKVTTSQKNLIQISCLSWVDSTFMYSVHVHMQCKSVCITALNTNVPNVSLACLDCFLKKTLNRDLYCVVLHNFYAKTEAYKSWIKFPRTTLDFCFNNINIKSKE